MLAQIKGAPLGLLQFLATESLLKVMKNALHFIFHQALFFSKYLNFCLDFLVMWKNSMSES